MINGVNVEIREMNLADCIEVYPLICELASGGVDGNGSSYRPPLDYYKEVFKEILEDKNKQYYVAREEDEIVGVIGLTANKSLVEAGNFAVVDELVVTEKCRKRGIGQLLLDKAITFAKENACYNICLTSGVNRISAHKLYEKNGYKSVGLKFEKMQNMY